VVPKQPGAAVMVVAGRLKGHKAELLQVNSGNEVAAVKLVADLSVQRLHLDEIAQYMGAMEEDY
jgi:ribosomal protein L24